MILANLSTSSRLLCERRGSEMLFPRKYQRIIIACILLVISLIILSYGVKQPEEPGVPRRLILETAAPLINVLNSSFRTVSEVWKRYLFLVGLEEENRRLKKENARLVSEVIKYREGYLESSRLQKLLELSENIEYSSIAARVIAKDQASINKTILIDRGTAHGIRVGLPVVADQGVVGRTIETTWHASRVLLLIDENSNIDALIQGSRVQGILQGSSPGGCSLKYVPKTETINAGDVVLTSGLAGMFPKGLLLGVVQRADKTDSGLFQKIVVTPSVDLSRLEEVVILLIHKDNPK